MPAAPKPPPSTKKPSNLTKPKGAVRAKSGCYTCRIRRKKCDEKRMSNEDGTCETCQRLKLECLGFGAKRPDWLRETTRVSEIRDRIKAHLAAQGMIKGHPGSGSRNNVQEILRLSEPHQGEMIYPSGGSSSSASSPRRDESVESDHHHLGHLVYENTSPMRYDPHHHYHSHHDYPVHSDIPSRSDSPDTAIHSVDYDSRDHPFSRLETPAMRSSFSLAGHYEYRFPTDGESYDDERYFPSEQSLTLYRPTAQFSFEIIDESLRKYVNNVVNIQYLFGDKTVLPKMIWEAIRNHPDSHEAVTLLSRFYHQRQANRHAHVLGDSEVKKTIRSLKDSLNTKVKVRFTADDAMTALHVISLYLFHGGRGKWNDFLGLAAMYVAHVFENPRNPAYRGNYSDILLSASDKDEFVIKTTIWFDVLGSITTQQRPILLHYINELFDPDITYIGEGRSPHSMMSPMGCQNIVVWALANTSALSCWKREQQENGTLSIPELVQKVNKIEQHLYPGPRPERPQSSEEEWSRYLASEVFRTSTRLFLKTVESGDFPNVIGVKNAVNDTFNAIRDFPINLGESKSAVVRSTVFGIFLCGSLTNDDRQRRELKLQLEQHTHEVVGNTFMTALLLEELWTTPRGASVPWRDLLKMNKVLLV